MTIKARITGIGSYLPEKVMTNKDFESLVDTTDEWIVSRTGMRRRHIAAEGEHPSDMGYRAALVALDNSKTSIDAIDMILVATMSPEYIGTSTAALIQNKLKATRAAAVDLQAACSGYLYALSTAKAYIESGMYRNVLIIASEKMSSLVDYTDRTTCVLFGDGATAAVVTGEGKGISIDSICLGCDGSLVELLYIPAGGTRQPASQQSVSEHMHYIKMSGRELFKHAVRRMGQVAEECLKKSNCTIDDIRWVIPHQANIRIIDALAKQAGVPSERVCVTVDKYGNTSASTIGIALDELKKENKLTSGDKLLLLAFGGGLTWGAAILDVEA